MNRYECLSLVWGAVGLVALVLILSAGPQPAVHAAGNTFKVPDDYPTIQGAIDAAGGGDSILVAQGTYTENLSISEGLTLSGGWNPGFTSRTVGTSIIDGGHVGRVISITCSSSETAVTVDGFTVQNGDASGLGVPATAESADQSFDEILGGSSQDQPAARGAEASDELSPTEQAAELRARWAGLAARGLYPGGTSALQDALAMLERRTVQAEEARARAGLSPADVQAEGGADVGGGIYSWNASLHLFNSTVQYNVGSVGGDGSGGGIFAGQAATSGTVISGNVVLYNTASTYGAGRGGGLYLLQTPGVVVEDNQFVENVASEGGLAGVGGGIAVDESSSVLIKDNRFELNTAHGSWSCPGWAGGGTGGGVDIRLSDGVVLTGNVLRDNLAALHCGSHGGGLYVYRADNVQVTDNEVIGNWGVLDQVYSDDYGGGLGLDTIDGLTVTGNVVRSNATTVVTPDSGLHVAYGGGLFSYSLTDSRIMSNTITANSASNDLSGFGGGAFLVGTYGVLVADNVFSENVASLLSSGGGRGGGLALRNTVDTEIRHNRFEGNWGSPDGGSHGGALMIASDGPYTIDTTVDSNLFLDNYATANPSAESYGGACVVTSHGFAFTNNVVAGNTAGQVGGLFLGLAERGVVTNNTFAGNSDAAVWNHEWTTPVTFTNNIVVDHTVGISVSEGSTVTVLYTLWNGNGADIAGSGTVNQTHPVTGDPAFADPAAHNYHLTTASAALDAGDPAGVPPAPPEDLDGVSRPQGPAVDLGAYEWRGRWQYLPLVMKHWRPPIGWAVGEGGIIVHTTDGGQTWARQTLPPGLGGVDLNGVAAIDEHQVWVVGNSVGNYGLILRTYDGGRTWHRQGSTVQVPDVSLEGVYAVDSSTAWATGGDVILHTTNGGQTWTRQGQGTVPAIGLEGVYASDADHAWVVGNDMSPGDGTILRTTNGGASWEKRAGAYDHTPLIWIHGADANTVWAVGPGVVLNTTDGGATWSNQTPAEVGPQHVNGVFAVDRDTVWAVTDAGGIYRSDDGGDDWDKQVSPTSDWIMRIWALNKAQAWAVTIPVVPTYPGHILRTMDGGQTWVELKPGVDTEWGQAAFVR